MEDSNLGDLLPPDIAAKVEAGGVKKATMATLPLFLLAVLAGAFVALGGDFSTIIQTGSQGAPWGVIKTLAGLAFSLGLILVVIGGAELFTGNMLIVMAVASRRVPARALLRNWGWVYLGNFVGAIATALFVFLGQQYTSSGGQVGALTVQIAEHKCALDFVPALFLGISCNGLVCLAVWLSMGARTIPGKILAIVFPITAFVAAGFEHCVANMYAIPLGLFIKNAAAPAEGGPLAAAIAASPHLTWPRFFYANLLPVTIGNIIGGAVMVGLVYWLIYRRPALAQAKAGSEPVRI